MCRKNLSGEKGRRCPSHTEPEMVEARNEIRREQYAMNKLRDKTAEFLVAANISFHRGDAVKSEYFQGEDTYNPDKFTPVKDPSPITESWVQPGYFQSKPEDGGLWTSPGYTAEDGGVKTAWTDWSTSEGFRVKDTPISPLRVKNQAIIAEINSRADLEALCKAFPRTGGGFSYESLATAGVDGVRLTEDGLKAAKRAGLDDPMHYFSHWDLDSTVWLSKDSISTGKAVKKAVYPAPERDDDDRYDGYGDDEDEYASWDFLNKVAEEYEANNKEGLTPA